MTLMHFRTGETQSMMYETAAHEFGHALGLPDVYTPAAMKEPEGFPGDIMRADFGNRVQMWDAEALKLEY